MSSITKKIANTMQEAAKSKTSAYDTSATIRRVEGKTAWVHIPGGVDETPVKMTIAAKEGDTVQVRVSDGTAFLVGNASAPPTDDATANTAIYVANNAQAEADTAHRAAVDAVTSAEEAASAAASAQSSAAAAQTSANEANEQATYATTYANNALVQLSTVENVVDVLTWIEDNGRFDPSTDVTVQVTKTYYVPANNTLTLTDGVTELNGLTIVISDGVVIVNGTASADTTVTLGTPAVTYTETIYLSGCTGGTSSTYWLRYGGGGSQVRVYDGVVMTTAASGTANRYYLEVKSGYQAINLTFRPMVSNDNDGLEYAIVENPTGNPSTQGYYELNIDDSVRAYVESHLALTNDGLYVLNDASAYKMLLANDGMYIQAPNGSVVNQSTADGNTIMTTNGTVIAHLGYGGGANGAGSVSNDPYYTLGIRLAVSEYSNTSLYAVGDLCYRSETTPVPYISLYQCKTAITTAENWNSSHWTSLGAVIGNYSVVEGVDNVGGGYASHTEGHDNINQGDYTHVEGSNHVIHNGSGGENHFEGSSHKLLNGGSRNHVQGYGHTLQMGAETYCNDCFVGGVGQTLSGVRANTVIGKYATSMGGADSLNPWGDYAFKIGNGTATNARSNALTVDWSGNVDIASGAKYKINGTNLSASDVGALSSSTTYVSGVKGNSESTYRSGNVNLTSANIGAVALTDKYTRTSTGGLDWSSQADGDAKVIAKSALAFWNGSFDGTTSWLTRCKTGEIIGSQGGTMTGQLKTSFKTSVAMGSYGSSQTTVDGLVGEVRYSSGCSGSASIGTAYTANGVTIATGWYNFMYMPHRSGGSNGSADGDNHQYGNLFLFGMNNTNGRFVIRVSSSAIAEVVKLVTTADIATTTATPSITTSTGTLVSATIARNGKLRTLFLRVKNSSAISAGSNVYQGTIAATDRPAVWANGVGYYGSAGIMFQLKDTGEITGRVIGAQLTANGEVYASLTYVVA